MALYIIFDKFVRELQPLIDDQILFLLNILRTNEQNLTKFLGLTIAGQNDYCDTIAIVKNPIAILLLNIAASYCNTIAITIGSIFCF